MLSDEMQLALRDAANGLVPGRDGKKCHFSTLWRWITKGVLAPDGSRIRLEAIRRPGCWITSVEALERFFARLTPVHESVASPRTQIQRTNASARAAQSLRDAGV